MKMRIMKCLSARYWLCLACAAIAETFAFAADIGLNERFQTAVESQLARYRKAIVDDDIAHGEFTFDVRRLTYDFSRQFLPTDILSPNQTADSVTLAKVLPGVAVGQLAFTATDGTHHIFSSWIAERIQRPLAWMAEGYPVQPSADLSGLTNFIGRVLLAAQSGSQHTLKVSATPVGRTAVVKSAFFGKKYEVPFDRAFVAFIDDNPSANWGHAARLVFVKDDLSAFEVWFINEPLKVEVDSRAFDLMPVYQDVDEGPMPTLDEIRQSVVPSNAIELQNGVSVDGDVSHSYAILISGGGDRGNNHTRYWGDMAAVYGTLTLTYKMPKTNIIVCMSDGTSPDADVSYGTPSSQSHGLFPDNSSPLDLDGDGEADVDYSATQTSVKSAFASMRNKLTASDQLFVFITDHGLQDPESGLCKLVLWDKYFMSPSELAGLTSDLPCPVLFAFEFCYSGAFISALKAQSGGRAIATAASETTSSGWNRTSKVSGVTSAQGSNYMNPWVYYFVGAMRGIVPHMSIEPWGNGNYLCTGADASNDGWVSIKEASDYAKSKIKADGYPEEPNYDDSPNGIGNDLCLIKKSASLPTIPSAPTVRISGTTLSWDPVYGAKYYKVYRATTPYDDPVEYKTWQTGTSCQIEKPSAEGTAYFWFVKAASEKDDATAGPFNAFKVVTGNSDYTLLQYTSDRNYTVYNDDAEFHLLGSAASTVTPYDASSCMQTSGGNLKFTSTKSGSGITVTANGTDLATSPSIANSFLGKWTLKIVATANTTATPRSYSFYSNATVPSGWSSTTGGTYGQHSLFWIARPHYIYQAPGKPNFSIGTTKLDVAAEGGTCSVSITLSANRTSWTATASKDWIRLYRQGSMGSAVLGFVVEKNETGSDRTAVVTIDDGWGDAKTLTVTQAGSVAVSLSSISISGESTVTSGGNTTYTCTATMSDGTTKAVTPTWSIYSGSSYASISTSGKLTANTVTSSQSVTVKASYTEGGVTKTATKSVTINPPAVSLSSISINGPDYVYAGKTGNFAASATMSDGTTKSITPTWSIYSGASYASISAAGVLTGKTVSSPQSVTIKASYTEGGVTKTATKTVTVYPTFTLATALDNNTLTFTTGGNADWFGQGKTTYDGTDAARSGIITHNQNSWMQTTVTGPGTFSFKWYASSEIGTSSWYDYLTFSIDGVQTNKIGGTSCSWTQCSYTLGTGIHTLKWNYLKDGTQDKGEDAGFVDQIVWTPTQTYTVYYNPGSQGTGSQKTAIKTHDIPLTLLGATFTRDGYTQTGWATTDGGAQAYPLNGVYTANATATFYPVWTMEAMPPPTSEEIAESLGCCLLDFYAEVSADGVGYWRPSGANMIISGLSSGQWSSVMATANGPCFVDWNWACVSNKSECGLFLFVDNEVVDMARSSTGEHSYRYIGDGEHTLDWCFIQGDMPAGSQGGLAGLNAVGVYYPITYDLNGAEGSLPIPPEWYYRHVDESGHTNFFFEVGGEVSLLSASGLSKPGYSFVGWECSLDGEVYEAGEGYVVPDEPTVFTAKWEVAQTYTVTYRPGANGVGSQKTSVKAHGVALQLLGATFTRTGYTQTGWSTTDGGAQAYALNAMYAANAAMTLYPVWTANTYMVAFSANGGDGSMEAQSFTYDVAQNLRPNAFTREGYDFLGWAWTPTNEVPQFADGEAIKNLVEFDGCELTLFAVWSEIASSDPVPANYVTVSSSTYYGEGLAFPYDNIDYALTYANPSDADPISTLVISNVLDEAFDCTCAAVGSIVIAGERFDDLSGVMEGRDTFTLSSGVKVDVSIDPDVATRTVVWTFTASSSSGKGVLLCPGQTLVANYSACPCNVLGDDFIGYEIGTEVYFIADGGVPVYSETPCVNVIACQPDAPTGLTVSFNKNAAGNNYLATLAWDPEWPDNTRYIIYRSDSILIDWDNPYDETTGVSYTDPDAGLVGGNTKYYAVCACPTGPYIQGCGATVSAVVPVLLEPKEMSYDIDAEGVAVPEVVDVKANCEWQFETNSADAWLHILKSSASALTFTVDPNDGEARSSIVRLLAGTVVVPVTFSQKAVQVVKYTVTFDANGGACEIPSKIVGEGEPVGGLPDATYAGHSFVGWFTEDGMQVSANTIVNGDITYFAHWVPVVEQPAWTPVVKGMNLTLYALVYDKAADAYLDAEGSVLAAFDADGECRGKVAVMTGPNGIRVYQLTIGYESSGERGVTLKLWDAASGEIVDIPASEILYAPSQLIGKIAEPVVYQVGVLTQEITLNEGWNWVSTFLTVEENDVGTFFGDFEFADDDVVKGEASSATYFDCAWYPDDFMIEPCRAYVVKKSAGGTESHEVEGFATEGAISVDDGWNWFGSCSSAVKTVADLRHSEGFSDDDIIKGALESATYKNGNWYPSTMQLKPGVGYLAKLANGGEFTFEVGASSANAARNALVMKGMPNEQVAPDWKPVVKPGTFTVYARAKDAEGNYIETDGSLLAAFDGNGECRGVCAIDDGPSVKFYQLNIGVESDGEPPLTLKVWNAADGSVSEIGEKVSGNINDLIGTISVPIEYQIASGDPTPAVRSADFGMTFNGKSLTVDVGKQPSTWSVVGSSPIAGNYVESANGFALDLGTCSAGPNISVSPMIDSGKSFAISYFGTIGTVAKGVVWALRYSSDLQGLVFQQGAAGTLQLRWMKSKSSAETAIALITGITAEELVKPHHYLVQVSTGGLVSLYMDGVKVYSAVNSTRNFTAHTYDGLSLGRAYGGDDLSSYKYGDGVVDDFRVFTSSAESCLSDEEVAILSASFSRGAIYPELPSNPTSADVYEALDGSADAHLQECITEPTVYNAYRVWAETVKAPGGSTAAGAQAVKDSPNAWLSFALDSATLIQTPPADGDVKVEKFEQTATAGSFEFTVGVENIPVGDAATPSNLAKVFGIEGGSTLSPQDMSFDKVDITFGTPENGKVKFTAGPKDKTLPTFFMKVKLTP